MIVPPSRGKRDHVKRAHQFCEQSVGYVGVAHGGANGAVTKKDLKDACIGSGLHQVGCKAVSECVHGGLLGKTSIPHDLPEYRAHR